MTMSIQINEITEQSAQLYTKKGKLIGTITSVLQLNDVRVQIKEQGVSGYYILWKNEVIEISSNGRLSEHPQGFFDLFDDQLDKLIEWG